MIKQTWNLDDDEKLRILNLHESATKRHYLIDEQQQVKVGEKTVSTDKKIELDKKSYPAGFYSIDRLGDGKKDLDNKLQEIAQFVKENDGTRVSIQIEVGESKVTNRDNELGKPLSPGELARLRGEKLQEYLTKHFERLIKSSYLTAMPIIPPPQTNVELGTQKYEYIKGTSDPKDPKYLEDQYVKFNISLSSTKTEDIYECLVNLTIDVSYYHNKNPKFPCRGGHECNNAEFEVYLDSVLLGVANLNNLGCTNNLSKDSSACDRMAKFVVTDEMVKKITTNPKWNKKTIMLSTRCISSNCHTSIQEVRIVNGENLEVYHGCVNPQSARGNTSQKILAVLDKCGKPIEGTIDDSISDEEVKALSDQISTSSNERIKEIVNNDGLTPTGINGLNLFSSSKNLEIINISPDGEFLTVTVKFNSKFNSGNVKHPLGISKLFNYNFNTGETGKFKYPIANVNVPQKRLNKLVEDGYLVKVPNFNGYYTYYSVNLGGIKYPVNTILVPNGE